MVCELHDKISMLWSFVKNHLKSKVLVFLASCKQVKTFFIYLRVKFLIHFSDIMGKKVNDREQMYYVEFYVTSSHITGVINCSLNKRFSIVNIIFFHCNTPLYCLLGEVYPRDFPATETWGNCVGVTRRHEPAKESGHVQPVLS